jgi:type IV pilus assembly protein PilZ
MSFHRPEGPRQGILPIAIKTKNELYAAYMPFIKNGGLFIPTGKPYQLGDDVFMLITFMDDPEKLPVAGRVVWISPPGAQGNRMAGIGVQFSDIDKGRARNKIEAYLAGMMQSQHPTSTM